MEPIASSRPIGRCDKSLHVRRFSFTRVTEDLIVYSLQNNSAGLLRKRPKRVLWPPLYIDKGQRVKRRRSMQTDRRRDTKQLLYSYRYGRFTSDDKNQYLLMSELSKKCFAVSVRRWMWYPLPVQQSIAGRNDMPARQGHINGAAI